MAMVLFHRPDTVPTLPRGNAVLNAPRCPRDAERPDRHSHGDHGSEWDNHCSDAKRIPANRLGLPLRILDYHDSMRGERVT